MKMALLGASGRVGQRITMEALVRGHVVKALVRNPESFPIAHPRLTVARVDIFDPASVAEAITDSDVVVNATGAGGSDPHTFFVNSTKAVIEGVKRAGGSQRLIVVGGAGSLEVAPGVQLVDTPTFSAAARPTSLAQRETLDILRASAIAWTFFSPSEHFAPGRRTGKYRLGTDQLLTNDDGESFISMEDYAFALLDEIEQPRFIVVSSRKPLASAAGRNGCLPAWGGRGRPLTRRRQVVWCASTCLALLSFSTFVLGYDILLL